MNSSSRKTLESALRADVTFASLSTNVARVSHILEHQLSFTSLRNQVKANLLKSRQAMAKGSTEADYFTEMAQYHMITDSQIEARVALRKALLYIPADQPEKKMQLFTNLAEVHFDMDNYEAALWAVDQAAEIRLHCKGINFNEAIIEQVLLRAKCLRKLGQVEEAVDVVETLLRDTFGMGQDQTEIRDFLEELKQEEETSKLSNQVKKIFHATSKCPPRNVTAVYQDIDLTRITIGNSPQFGRHFIAKATIPAEATILKERPISVALQPNSRGIKCTACHRDLDYRYYPCDQCTAAIYCDRRCADQDWADTHRRTCHGVGPLVLGQIGSFPLHLFQMVTRVGGPKAAMAIQAAASTEYTVEQYLAERSKAKMKSEQIIADYKMATILTCNEGKHDSEADVNHTVMALETAMTLLVTSEEEEEENASDQDAEESTFFFIQFAAMLVTDLRRIIYNVFGWTDWAANQHIANCQVLVGSLVNHSCVPNVKWTWSDGVICFKSKREIAAGEEITISYGPNASQAYYDRQMCLNHYHFACTCPACFKSAISGSALKCLACRTGPVVVDSALNLHPLLNGKCLSCRTQYTQLNRAKHQLSHTKAAIKMVTMLSRVRPSEPCLLQEAMNQLTTLHKLALVENESTVKATLAMAATFKRCKHLLVKKSLDERLELVSLLNRCLPEALPVQLLSRKAVQSLHFWFEMTLKWANELIPEPEECHFEPREAHHLVLMLHGRFQAALMSILKHAKDDIQIGQWVKEQMKQVDEKLNKYLVSF